MILINKDNIVKTDVNSEKVRLIAFKNGKLLVANYNGIYMLPGGKFNYNESKEEALIREIKEETGNTIDISDINYYNTVVYYAKNYLHRDCLVQKKTITHYFETDKELDILPGNLSEREREGNFKLEYVSIPELFELLNQNDMTNKQLVFATELKELLTNYLKNHKLIDLHTHTIYSDGQYYPNEVIDKAIKANIKTIAITDHDSLLGIKNIDYEKYKEQIDIIPGIELSVKRDKGRMHILGLNIDPNNYKLNYEMDDFRNNSINKIILITEYLRSIGINITDNELNSIITRIGNIGRPHIAKLLIEKGYVSTVKEAFDKYLIEAYDMVRQNMKGYTYQEIISLILEANGIPILAHPNSLELNHEEFEELLIDMINIGLKGLEVYHSDMSDEDRIYYMDMVKKYNLLYSVGSDFHGEKVKPNIKLGYGDNNLFYDNASVLEYIKR